MTIGGSLLATGLAARNDVGCGGFVCHGEGWAICGPAGVLNMFGPAIGAAPRLNGLKLLGCGTFAYCGGGCCSHVVVGPTAGAVCRVGFSHWRIRSDVAASGLFAVFTGQLELAAPEAGLPQVFAPNGLAPTLLGVFAEGLELNQELIVEFVAGLFQAGAELVNCELGEKVGAEAAVARFPGNGFESWGKFSPQVDGSFHTGVGRTAGAAPKFIAGAVDGAE